MELATLTSKGQITLPMYVRKKMNLRNGDKIVIFEDDDKFFFQNSNVIALEKFQKNMKGAAEEAGFRDPDDVMDYIKQLRKNKLN
jgi:AbrB family looped-hinge helix DNA binding protein